MRDNGRDRKITYAISSGLIMICLLTNLVFNLTIRSQNLENTQILSNEKAVSVGKKITDIFDNSSMITEYLAKNTAVLRYLENVNSREDINNDYFIQAMRELKNIKSINKYYYLTWIGNVRGNFFIDSRGYVSDEEFEAEKRPWYGDMMNSRGVAFSEPYIELGNNEIVISVIRKIIMNNGVAFTAIDFSFKGIEKIFSDVSLGKKDQIFLLNRDGSYLYNKDKSKVLTSNFFIDNSISRDIEVRVKSGETYFGEVTIHNQKYYLSTIQIENSGWYVAILIDKKSLFEPINNIFMVDFILSFLVVIVVITLINGHISKYFKSNRDIKTLVRKISEKTLDPDEIPDHDSDDVISDIYEKLTSINYVIRNNIDKENYRKCEAIEKEIDEIKLSVEKIYNDLQQPINVIGTTESFLKKLVEINSKKADNGLMTSDDLDKLLHDVEEVNSIVKNNLNKIIKYSEKLNYSKYNS